MHVPNKKKTKGKKGRNLEFIADTTKGTHHPLHLSNCTHLVLTSTLLWLVKSRSPSLMWLPQWEPALTGLGRLWKPLESLRHGEALNLPVELLPTLRGVADSGLRGQRVIGDGDGSMSFGDV